MFQYVRRLPAAHQPVVAGVPLVVWLHHGRGARVVGTAAGAVGKEPLGASTPHHMEDSVKDLARSVSPPPFIGCSLGDERVQNPPLLGDQ
jgi:hypothetical protein